MINQQNVTSVLQLLLKSVCKLILRTELDVLKAYFASLKHTNLQ